MVGLPEYTIHEIGEINSLSQVAHWGITDLQIPDLWKTTQGENTVVAILDTGIPNHDDLNENILINKCRSFIKTEFSDKNGHNTHVAGIVGGSNNTFGVVGVAPKCKLVCLKVLGDSGFSTTNSILDGLKYCLDLKPDVINMSVGGTSPMPEVQAVLKQLVDKGIPIVVSAGNNGEKADKSVLYPAKYDECIAVGSYSPTLITSKSLFSSVGPEVDIAAPGDKILSTFLDNKYAIMSGTSQAAPIISGIIALLISYYKKNNIPYTVDSIKKALFEHCKDVGPEGKDENFGWGIISPKNLFAAKTQAAPIKLSLWQRIKKFFN